MSSSFDADRLDYLRRDKLMTGTGAGGIDFDWLMEHVRVDKVSIDAGDKVDESTNQVATFCLDLKAKPAAEQFLLARYTLHEQVYFHKTTRCVEAMIKQLFQRVAGLASKSKAASRQTGLEGSNPLLRFFGRGGETLENYLALDDIVVWASISQMLHASNSEIAELAKRLCERRLFKALDLRVFGDDEGTQNKFARKFDEQFKVELKSGHVVKDEDASVTIYTQIGGDDDKFHKKLHIRDAKGPREITELSIMIKALAEKNQFIRYYFAEESDRQKALAGRRVRV